MIPDNVEKIIITKEDYDRNVEQLLIEKLELQERIQRQEAYIKYLEERTPIQSKKYYGDGREELEEKIEKVIKILKNHDHEYAGAVHSALNILVGERYE